MAIEPEIPLDIRDAMHDCILSIFWPKQKIIEFLHSTGCPKGLIDSPNTEISRHMIVANAFSRLISRPDRGYSIFQIMIDRLSNWSYFDPYYFEKLAKLNRTDAEQKIRRLKSAIEQRNTSAVIRRAAATASQRQQKSKIDLTALHKAFNEIFGTGMTVQARGSMFEIFLKDLFVKNGITMGDPFRLDGEQIDGSFKFDGENYIVEAKWQDPTTSTSQLYSFAHKVDGKMHGRGLFISANGFSNEGIRAIVHGKHIQTILMDGEDISYILEERVTLEILLDYKIRAAQTRGDVYVCALRKISKV